MVPFLARALTSDRPVTLDLGGKVVRISDECSIVFSNDWISREAFAPYRQPIVRTLAEGWGYDLEVLLAQFRGRVEPRRFELQLGLLLEYVHTKVKDLCAEPSAIRFGKPYLSVLQGDDTGKHVPLPFPARTYVCTQGRTPLLERAWFLPTKASKWIEPEIWTAAAADDVRWYHGERDCALWLQIDTPPGPDAYQELCENREYHEASWKRSYFLVGSKEECALLLTGLGREDYPSAQYPYGPGGHLLAWVESDYMPDFRPVQVELGGGNPVSDGLELYRQRFQDIVRRARDMAVGTNLKETSGTTARHIAAAADEDPWPNTRYVRYPADNLLTEEYFDIPSPIRPAGRVFVLQKAFQVGAKRDELTRFLHSLLVTDAQVEFLISDAEEPTYALSSMHVTCPDHLSTDDFLATCPLELFDQLEQALKSRWSDTQSITRSVWLHRYGILLGERSQSDDERSISTLMVGMWFNNGEDRPKGVQAREADGPE